MRFHVQDIVSIDLGVCKVSKMINKMRKQRTFKKYEELNEAVRDYLDQPHRINKDFADFKIVRK